MISLLEGAAWDDPELVIGTYRTSDIASFAPCASH
jgi:hypothetical protein